jgi:signal transduction histidine kinase/CheY-like chemotaxis protein
MTWAFLAASAAVFLWAALAGLVWWCRPSRPLAPFGLWFALSGLSWASGELGASFLARTPEAHWIFLLVLYTGVLFNTPLWWALAIAIASHYGVRPRWAGSWARYAPFGLAVVCWVALLTNPWHGAFLEPVLGGHNRYRVFWYLQASYGYALMLAALVLIGWSWSRQSAADAGRTHLAILFWASVGPLATNVLYVSRILHVGFDPTLIGFAFGLALGFFGIFYKRLFSLSGLTLDHWMDHDRDGVVILDGDGRLVRANPATWLLVGAEPMHPGSDFIGGLASRISDGPAGIQESPSTRESLRARLFDPDLPNEGWTVRLALDRRRWLRIHAAVIPGRWPSADGLGLRLRDDTQLEETSERAARQAASIEAILSSIRDGLFVVDDCGQLLYANERFWQMWHLSEVVDPSVVEADLLRALSARIERGALIETEEGTVTLKSGQVFSFGTAPLMRRHRQAGRVWTFRDVTERNKSERVKLQLEERIRESQKLESLGVLAGGVAHDFNNILVGILGNVDLATALVEPRSPLDRYLSGIKASADRAAELIQQLLAYAGRGRVAVVTLDLSALVEETKDLVRSAISKKAVLETNLSSGVFVAGDPVQLRQIVMNLLTNASDALGDAEGLIRVRTGFRRISARELDTVAPRPEALDRGVPQDPHSEPLTEDYAFLEVSDTGCGMDGSTVGRIFEPFFSTKFTGRGLGLSAALGIMRAHRGMVHVRSAPGQGSSFLLLFPRAEAPSSADALARLAAPARDRTTPATVLVVDDEEVVREVARSVLELEGYRILLAKDGHECVALFRENASGIDAIVLDMTMPRMDGAEALFAVRQISRDVPVVLSSGYSEQDTMARCSGLSGVSFIQKPYTSDRLLDKVTAAVRSRPVVAEGAASAGGRSGARS